MDGSVVLGKKNTRLLDQWDVSLAESVERAGSIPRRLDAGMVLGKKNNKYSLAQPVGRLLGWSRVRETPVQIPRRLALPFRVGIYFS